ncbi:MAG: hypothetical protein V2B13_09925, partial [Pseudomonadota bacterium]
DDKGFNGLGVHYRDLIRSGFGWRARQFKKMNPEKSKLEVGLKFYAEDQALREKFLSAIQSIYGKNSLSIAQNELGDGALTCVRVRRVVDTIRSGKEFFRNKFFLAGNTNDKTPLPGTFNALVDELKKEETIPQEFWVRGGVGTLKTLASKIIDNSREDLSEESRFREIWSNIKTFFTQRRALMDKVQGMPGIEDPLIRQDLNMVFRGYLLHPSVIQLLPEGARGQVMQTILVRYFMFLDQNSTDTQEKNPPDTQKQKMDSAIIPSESRRNSMTEFIFKNSTMPTVFKVEGSYRYRSEMNSFDRLDRGIHFEIWAFWTPQNPVQTPAPQEDQDNKDKNNDNN